MARIMDDIYVYLQTQVNVTGKVSDRIFPQQNPSSAATYPYMVVNQISETRTPHLTAASGLVRTTLQIDTFGDDWSDTVDAAEALRDELDGYRGTWNTTRTVQRCLLESRRDDLTPPSDAEQAGIYGVSQDFAIWHEETVPTF